jgi:uncharacterized protein YbjT (DUF2867 family)
MKAILAGSTGLIGSELIKAIESHPKYTSLVALAREARKDVGKIRWEKASFNDPEVTASQAKGADVAFCALGTTMKKAGSKDAFRRVDFEYVLNFARAAREAKVEVFVVVSAIGSDPESGVFYNQVKGEMEKALEELDFAYLYIMQPSILTGDRKEFRFGERLGIIGMQLISPLLLGGMKKYRPTKASDVASAMLNLALERPDLRRIQNREIDEWSKA